MSAEESLIAGTTFKNLNIPYENKCNKNEEVRLMVRETLLMKLMELDFMAVDLGLYLDTHPDNSEAIAEYNLYLIHI